MGSSQTDYYGFPPFSPPPPPPHKRPPPSPSPDNHPTVIVIVFVSLGGLFFLAFLSVALCCFIKKRKRRWFRRQTSLTLTSPEEEIIKKQDIASAIGKKKKMVQETEMVNVDEDLKVKEVVVQGPQGAQVVEVSMEDDVHIQEETIKNENVGESSHKELITSAIEKGESSSISSHHLGNKA
ncbi:hypothetical protein CK203_037632 [Vitis vinifera]|uniref:Uncharacterized protein n=1 Tax=Vitis vinifera TaxID=29760 RepID=A0A438HKI4_VITVI|nr:hypothetical protein CK203_037632 [Vitis vinifera]